MTYFVNKPLIHKRVFEESLCWGSSPEGRGTGKGESEARGKRGAEGEVLLKEGGLVSCFSSSMCFRLRAGSRPAPHQLILCTWLPGAMQQPSGWAGQHCSHVPM